MRPLLIMSAYTIGSGACILLGGLLGCIPRLGPGWLDLELRHTLIAFGGGVLVSAVAIVLVPEGTELLGSPTWCALAFLGGGLAFFLLERFLGLQRVETPQFEAMLLDFIPESLALGMLFGAGAATAPLLAVLIGLQNLPEGFNALRELTAASGRPAKGILVRMGMLIPIGPLLGLLGWYYGAHHPRALGAIMLFASGGIIYLLFQDIAPQSRLAKHWAPALGAVLGFSVGLLGDTLVRTV